MGPLSAQHPDELRCELVHRSRGLATTSVRLLENRVHVGTPVALANGDQVLVRLRVGDGAPLQLEAHVISRSFGDSAELVLGFVFDDDAERARVRELMRGGARDATPPLRVLIVERSAILSELLVFGARREPGLRDAIFDVARDGETAWTMIGGADYDAAIVDFHLPRITGAELTRRIRVAPALAALPIVAMSAGGDGAARRACLDAGASAFVDKPIKPRALFAVLAPFIHRQERA